MQNVLAKLWKKKPTRSLALLGVGVVAYWYYFHAGAPAQPTPPFKFADGFENASRFEQLFPRDFSRWHGAQRESAAQPSANSVELSTQIVHSGTNALKLVAAPYDGRTASKADIEREQLHFAKGDEVWSSVCYYLVGEDDPQLIFLWDLETTQYGKSPGRRLYLQNGGYLASDLGKWWSGKTFRQIKGQEAKFPHDRWVKVKVHLVLSERNDGVMEVWQDGVKVIDARGQTLPTARAVYNRLQVGITANGNRQFSHTLYVDDVVISNQPLP